jgi:hypothetical protein
MSSAKLAIVREENENEVPFPMKPTDSAVEEFRRRLIREIRTQHQYAHPDDPSVPISGR